MKSVMKWVGMAAVLLLLGWGIRQARYALQPAPAPVRALWVTRFDYTEPEDVARIIANVGRAGFTDVFFQIRGNASAFYQSEREPWAYELSGKDVAQLGRDPGWDPLQRAIDTARPYGLRVHAYMNVLPGWKGNVPPPESAGQLWTAHPEWFMIDSLGNKMLPTSGWYAFINPVLEPVRAHLRGIVSELSAYEVDGIHLDYIRYPYDYKLVARQHYPDVSEAQLLRHADFSYDPVSQTALLETYGWDVSREEITAFRCDSVTRLVKEIGWVLEAEGPTNALLTASVIGNPVEGKAHAFQDSKKWIRRGLIDWAVQMNYGTTSFDRYLALMKKAAGRRGFRDSVVVGINCKNELSDIVSQMDRASDAGSRGWALFSYTFLFDEKHRPTEKGTVLLNKIETLRAEAIPES